MSASLSVLLLLITTCTAYIHKLDKCVYNGTILPKGQVTYFNETCQKGVCYFDIGFIYGCDNKKPRAYCHLERVKGDFPRCCSWVYAC
uniref:Putative 8.9 kDa family member n=1 Tax=Rhipicephalus pulchellus TaxID=72859 RepID=L7MA14_RHIPC